MFLDCVKAKDITSNRVLNSSFGLNYKTYPYAAVMFRLKLSKELPNLN